MTRPWRVVVAGTNFGRVHAAGVRSAPAEFTLAGILSRGSERSAREAAALGVPHLTSIDDLGAVDVDAVSVAVGSAVSGGAGTELACAVLELGVPVLAEHPMHPHETLRCLKAARAAKTVFRVTTHYPHVRPVREFLAAAARLRSRQTPLFVDAATPVHVLHPLLDVLARALGGARPWAFAAPEAWPTELSPASPLRTVAGVIGGVPVTLRVQNQLHPGDRDNHALLWHRIAIGTEGGVLTLADTHGPVLWSPRFHADRDADGRLVLDGLAIPSTSATATACTFAEITGELWPDAVAHALRGLRTAAESGADALREGQPDVTAARMWADLAAKLGPPESIRPTRPAVLTAAEVLGGPGGDACAAARSTAAAPHADPRNPDAAPHRGSGPPHAAPGGPVAGQRSAGTGTAPATGRTAPPTTRDTAYGSTAEFYDLAARGVPEIGEVLAGADPSAGPVVEIGAGSGLVTEAIARALPGARILAAEPSTVLRSVLTSRVVGDPDLRRRVTVVPTSAQDLVLPDRMAAAVLCGVLGHLEAVERTELWERLLPRLAPGAPLVVELMALDGPLPRTRLARARLGRTDYEWWFAAERGADGALDLHSTWQAGDRVTAEHYRWHPLTLDDVAAETGRTLRVLRAGAGANAAPLGVLT